MRSTPWRLSALPVSDGEFPDWALLHRQPRRVLELPDIADRALLAYHEAGHAVALRAFRAPIWRAELAPMSGRVSQIIDTTPADDAGCFSPKEVATLADLTAIGQAAVAAAGWQAELLAVGHRHAVVTRVGSDEKLMTACLADRFDAPLPVAYCQQVASAILTRHWLGVEAVARYLYGLGTATGATIDNLLASAGCGAGIGIDWALSVVDGSGT